MVTHDKPGSCGPPGNWLDHLDDRARETRAAVDVLRSQPEVEGPVGLFGVSQGAWVASIAAVSDPSSVDFIVSMSGPGVAVHEQDRYRIAVALRSADLPPSDVDDALAWIDERTRRLLDGESIHAIIDEQQRLADRPWAPIALEFFDHPVTLRYLSRILAFDPVPSLSRISCPVLALFGAADIGSGA